jgi:hypothetical protein
MAQPGALGGPGPNGSAGAPNFHTPVNAVTAFLAALKAKDKDKLTQATAKRAATEAEEKHRKIFSEIIEGSISDDDLDEISKSFDGFKVMYMLNAKSTARIGVVIGKSTTGGGHLQRTIMARKEKDGWKVLDIEDLYNFKAMPNFGRGRTTRRK